MSQVTKKIRLALIVSHPIQYYVPLYQTLARRSDVEIKVFFTWHARELPTLDRGFQKEIAWDIPLTKGYHFEAVRNTAKDPGTHHFFGLRNPELVSHVRSWHPDAVHITGWAWYSNLVAIRAFARLNIPTLFRGDSHLLDTTRSRPFKLIKQILLRKVFSWPAGFLVVGTANRVYYETFGVSDQRLFYCPHSIDVGRFAEPAEAFDERALLLRKELDIAPENAVVLFAGKFDLNKRPLDLMRAMQNLRNQRSVCVVVGNGEFEQQIYDMASKEKRLFRILPFQNQTLMPVIYRMADLFVLPSRHETWGLAANEALACGRPILVSDGAGSALDVVDETCGRVFRSEDPSSLQTALAEMLADVTKLREMRAKASRRAWMFDVSVTEKSLMDALREICV